MKKAALLGVLLIVGSVAISQTTSKSDKAAAPKKAASAAADAMAPPPVSPEMLKVSKAMVGVWSVDEIYQASPMMPTGGKGKGRDVISTGPGGYSIIYDYRSQGPMGPITGHGLMSWSPTEKVFTSVWMDSGAPGAAVATGKWEGETIVLSGPVDINGQKMDFRQVISDFKPDSFRMTFAMGAKGAKPAPDMEFLFHRLPGGAMRKVEPAASKK
ncbi:MAG: DUF1579 family protein [Acidobacteriales bacterium]|nr:DUF1579 family protein [Terriglobales bacterium]